MIGIYKITNRINNKCYIGQSLNIEKRFKDHKRCKDDKPLYRAFEKYGINNFTFEVLEECSEIELDKREIYYISLYKSTTDDNGYNLDYGGQKVKEGLTRLFIHNRSQSKIGELNPMYGTKQSDDVIEKKVKGFKDAIEKMPKEKFNEWHKKIGAKHRGKIVSKEQRKKISNTLKEYYKNEEVRKNLSNKHKGKIISQSTRLKISLALRKKKKQFMKKVLQYDLDNNFIADFDSLNQIREKLGLSIGNISLCCNNKRKTAYGFKWVYKD